jgi:hypothetical protein
MITGFGSTSGNLDQTQTSERNISISFEAVNYRRWIDTIIADLAQITGGDTGKPVAARFIIGIGQDLGISGKLLLSPLDNVLAGNVTRSNLVLDTVLNESHNVLSFIGAGLALEPGIAYSAVLFAPATDPTAFDFSATTPAVTGFLAIYGRDTQLSDPFGKLN